MSGVEMREDIEKLQFRDPHQPNLHTVSWSRAGYTEKSNPNVLLWIHGIGEHSGRYKDVAERLLAEVPALDGIASYDHRGHGRSDGDRGVVGSVSELVDDFVERVSPRLALQFGPDANIVVVGHSLGGVVAAGATAGEDWLEAAACGKIVGIILSAPAIKPVIHGVVNKVLAPVSGIVIDIPGLRLMTKSSGLDASLLSHDEKEVASFEKDELVHDKVGLGLAADLLKFGPALTERVKVENAICKSRPCIMLFGELDPVCDRTAGKDFADAVGAEFVEVEGAFHEIHKETVECGREKFYATVVDFLKKVFV